MRFDRLPFLLCGVALLAIGHDVAEAQPTSYAAGSTFREEPASGTEVAVLGSLTLVVPSVGFRLSVPTWRGLFVETGFGVTPFTTNENSNDRVAIQLQMRVPRGTGDNGTRRSLIVGVSTFPVLDDFFTGGETRTRIRPHVGSTWQWRRKRGVDLRLDVGILGDFRSPVPVPYATVAAVFPARKRGAARSIRRRPEPGLV